MNYSMLIVLCLFVSHCGNEPKEDSSAEAKMLFDTAKNEHKGAAEGYIEKVQSLINNTPAFETKRDLIPSEKAVFKFAKRNVMGIDINETNSTIVRATKEGVKDEKPRNGFNVFSEMIKGTESLNQEFEAVYKDGGGS